MSNKADLLSIVGAEDDLNEFADRIEAALKRKADSIHRAMVIIAGIEMENSDDPPRLWTALEDAYDALSDAMGTDGETTADVEEAKATGRHFVVKPSNNSAKMRSELKCIDNIAKYLEAGTIRDVQHAYRNIQDRVRIALSKPPRNCDIGTPEEQSARFDAHCRKHMGCLTCPLREKDGCVPKHCEFAWAQMPYEEGGEE